MATTKTNAKNLLSQAKQVRTRIGSFLKEGAWMEEAKKIAEKQGKEIRKLIDTDVSKLRVFVDKERKELERLQAQIPGEVKKLKAFVDGRKKELANLLRTAKKKSAKTAGKKAATRKGSASTSGRAAGTKASPKGRTAKNASKAAAESPEAT